MEDLRKMMMEQITRGAYVRIPRLSQEEIDAYSRPRKRQAKKKYHFLSFDISDEEDDFFEVCYPPAKKTRRSKANVAVASKDSNDLPGTASSNEEKSTKKRRNSNAQRKNSSSDAQRKSSCSDIPSIKLKITRSMASDKSRSSSDKSKPATLELKPVITTEVKILKAPKEEPATYSVPRKVLDLKSAESKYLLGNIKKTEPCSTTTSPASSSPSSPVPNNSKIGKIRIKTAAELGSTVIFIDDHIPITTLLTAKSSGGSNTSRNNKNSSSSKSGGGGGVVAKTDNVNSSLKNSNIDVQLIGDLYAKLFNTKNQTKIRNAAQILQSIAENIKNNNERVQEITNNKDLTDAEKLRRRCLSFQDLKRKQEENEMKLKEKFESIIAIFDNNNFELLFQLLFLGILKILIVSVSYFYKKGTIFKRLITLLQQSLSNSKFNDERVFKLLRSKDFRDRCIALVQFIEKHCKTEFFSMLFLSDSDKNLIKTKNAVGAEPSAEDRNASFHKYIKPEVGNVQEGGESFLLNLLQESKANDPVSPPSSNHQQLQQQQQNPWKTYAPASKRNGTTANSSVPAPSNPPKTNATDANGLVNSFIFSDGQIKPYPNNQVINIQTTESSNNVRTARPQNDANNFLNRPASDANLPIGSEYHMNTPYNTHMKVYHANGLNGTHPLSTSNGNIENIQPGSYANTNNNAKKVTKDNTWNNGQVNGLRSLLVNESPTDPNRHNNYSRFLDPYGTPSINLNIAMPRSNAWMS